MCATLPSDAQLVLSGRRVLVVEDEYMIATELAALLSLHGAEVLGPAANVARARRVLDRAGLPDTALLDVDLGGELVWPIAALLMDAGTALILTTGYDVHVIPPAFAHLPRCEKPAPPELVLKMLAHATGCPGGGRVS